MNLLFDLIATQPCGDSKYHGGGEYAKIVFKHLLANSDPEEIVCFYDKNLELDQEIKDLAEYHNLQLLTVSTNEDLSFILNRGTFHTFYSALPYRYHDLKVEAKGIKLIYTIHGLRQIELPTDRYELKYRKGLVEKMKFIAKNTFKASFIRHKKDQIEKIMNTKSELEIVVPSNHTKYSLLSYFPQLHTSNVKVMYSPRKTDEECGYYDFEAHGINPQEYFLIISGNRWLKNGFRAIKGLDQIYSKFSTNVKTVVLGVKNDDIYRKAIQNPDMFLFLDYVSPDQLDFFYRNAYCFIYPTLNEGFGYPPLECMRYGVPVIASSITSISEVCRDGVIYFNPFSIDELKNRVLSVLFDSSIRDDYSKRGYKVYETVSRQQDRDLDRLIRLLTGRDDALLEDEARDTLEIDSDKERLALKVDAL